mmetsp:Transcript_26293/g.52579  ORF Transcript_26293/g.52579 Transcript_26293/m.52579 type:complete len:300 (-) Transcript_26293:26-925(-)
MKSGIWIRRWPSPVARLYTPLRAPKFRDAGQPDPIWIRHRPRAARRDGDPAAGSDAAPSRAPLRGQVDEDAVRLADPHERGPLPIHPALLQPYAVRARDELALQPLSVHHVEPADGQALEPPRRLWRAVRKHPVAVERVPTWPRGWSRRRRLRHATDASVGPALAGERQSVLVGLGAGPGQPGLLVGALEEVASALALARVRNLDAVVFALVVVTAHLAVEEAAHRLVAAVGEVEHGDLRQQVDIPVRPDVRRRNLDAYVARIVPGLRLRSSSGRGADELYLRRNDARQAPSVDGLDGR